MEINTVKIRDYVGGNLNIDISKLSDADVIKLAKQIRDKENVD